MKFLVINDDTGLTDDIEKKLCSYDKKNKCLYSTFSIEQINIDTKELKNIGFCAILTQNPASIDTNFLSFLFELKGFLLSENILIITNLEVLSKQTILSKNNVKLIKSSKDFISYLDDNFQDIISKATKRLAKKKLLDKGIPYTQDCFATYIAKNKIQIFNDFLEAGMDINSRDDLGTPILNVACRNDNYEFVTKILDLGADINAVSLDRGYTAVMDSVWRGNEKITSYLIKKGAELNTINKEGQTNLILAVGANRYNICKLLVENGSDPDVKDQMGMSAYTYACLFKKTSIAELLKPYHKE